MKGKIRHAANKLGAGIISAYKRLGWEDALLILAIGMLLLINQSLLSQLQQLPSPLYGGDYYNHLGSIEHIYQGGSVFESGQMLDEIQWVPWLYHLLVVLFAKITGLSPMMAIIWFSQVALILGCVIIYLLVSKFFNNKLFGLIAVLWQGANFPVYKYSPFAFYVILPLFTLAAYNFMKKEDYTTATLLGVAYGLVGLSNTYMFIQGTFLMAVLAAYYVLFKTISFAGPLRLPKLFSQIKVDKEMFLRNFARAAVACLLGFGIALLWWFKPIFVYHAKTLNDMQIYGFKEVTGLGGMLSLVSDGLYSEVFHMYSPMTYFLGIGTIIGFALLIFLKHRKEEHKLMLIMLFSAAIGLFIHFITLPLLGTLMASGGLFDVAMMITTLLLSLFTLDFASRLAEKKYKNAGFAIIFMVLVLFAFNLNQHYKEYPSDQWYQVGKNQISPQLLETRAWILANTNVNDVFLSTNEDSFALNALSGRKIVTNRRTHSSPYADMNQRMLDAGIILYGQNDELRAALLKKYSVDYLYWQPGWLRNEFQFNDQGQVQGFFDPLMIDYSPVREQVLKENNVSYTRTKYYMDPAWVPNYPKRDVLVVLPVRANISAPWRDSLDKYLTIVKEINQSGQPITIIYKVNA